MDTPFVSQNLDGCLKVFVHDTSTGIAHIWQCSSPTNQVCTNFWSGWASLGPGIVSSPAVGRNADGRLEVFAVGCLAVCSKRFNVVHPPVRFVVAPGVGGSPSAGIQRARHQPSVRIRMARWRCFSLASMGPSGIDISAVVAGAGVAGHH